VRTDGPRRARKGRHASPDDFTPFEELAHWVLATGGHVQFSATSHALQYKRTVWYLYLSLENDFIMLPLMTVLGRTQDELLQHADAPFLAEVSELARQLSDPVVAMAVLAGASPW
jgi:hypothetical protein